MPRESVQNMVEQIKAVMQYLDRIQKSPGHTVAMEKQTAALKEHMDSCIFGPVDAGTVRDALESTQAWKSFPSHLKLQLEAKLDERSAIHAPTWNSKGGMNIGNKTQDWEACWTSMPLELYEKIKQNITPVQRMNLVFQWLSDDGLRNPSEKTYQAMLGIHYFFEGSMPECPWENYNRVQSVKAQFKAFVSHLAAPADWTWSMPRRLNSQTNRLNLDQNTFMQIVGMIPIRTSDSRLKTCMPGSRTQVSILRSSKSTSNLMLMDSTTQSDFKGESNDAKGATITQPKSAKQIKLRSTVPLRLALPAPPALPAPGDDVEPFAEKSELLQPGDEPAVPKFGQGQAGSRRSLAEVTAEISDSCGKQPRKRPAAAKASTVGRAKATAEKPAEQKEPSGRPAKARKPAEQKEPSVNWKRDPPSKEIRAQMRNATVEEKVRFHQEHGCSKCVWKPGCSPSCWKQRGMEVPSN